MRVFVRLLELLALVLMLGAFIAACWGIALADPFLFFGAYAGAMVSALLMMLVDYKLYRYASWMPQQGTPFNPWN
jgi:hypothetical protein